MRLIALATNGVNSADELAIGFKPSFTIRSRTPRAVIARLESEVRKAFAMPEVRDRILKLGLNPIASSSAEFAPFVVNAITRMSEASRIAGIEPE